MFYILLCLLKTYVFILFDIANVLVYILWNTIDSKYSYLVFYSSLHSWIEWTGYSQQQRQENTNFLLDFNVVVINAICIVDVISNNKLAWYRQSFQTRIIVCYIGKQYSHCHKRCVPLYRFPVLIPFLDCSDITSCVNVTQEHVSKVT